MLQVKATVRGQRLGLKYMVFVCSSSCEQTQQPCDSFPCQHGGSCVNFGNIRYECTCVLGYTGVNCETNIGKFSMDTKTQAEFQNFVSVQVTIEAKH